MANYIVTANQTLDGVPVYLGTDRVWVLGLNAAEVFEDRSGADDALVWARIQESAVCDPFVLPVLREDERLVPLTTKHRIRSAGADVMLARLGYLPSAEQTSGGHNVSV